MRVMTKLSTILRSRVRENAEVLIDANAIRIFEQELLDSHDYISQSKHQLTLLMAERLRLERNNQDLESTIQRRELQAAEALKKDRLELATSLAEDIVGIEQVLSQQEAVLSALRSREEKLKGEIRTGVKKITDYQRELSAAKATQNAQNAMTGLPGSPVNVGQVNLQESLARIKGVQQRFDDHQRAAEELNEHIESNGLDQQLKEAGILSNKKNVDAVLARIQRE